MKKKERKMDKTDGVLAKQPKKQQERNISNKLQCSNGS
jgi:hypothetical protein